MGCAGCRVRQHLPGGDRRLHRECCLPDHRRRSQHHRRRALVDPDGLQRDRCLAAAAGRASCRQARAEAGVPRLGGGLHPRVAAVQSCPQCGRAHRLQGCAGGRGIGDLPGVVVARSSGVPRPAALHGRRRLGRRRGARRCCRAVRGRTADRTLRLARHLLAERPHRRRRRGPGSPRAHRVAVARRHRTSGRHRCSRECPRCCTRAAGRGAGRALGIHQRPYIDADRGGSGAAAGPRLAVTSSSLSGARPRAVQDPVVPGGHRCHAVLRVRLPRGFLHQLPAAAAALGLADLEDGSRAQPGPADVGRHFLAVRPRRGPCGPPVAHGRGVRAVRRLLRMAVLACRCRTRLRVGLPPVDAHAGRRRRAGDHLHDRRAPG